MSKYRDELVQTIKLMGQELIDRAESMVHEDCDMITNFNINIDIPQPMDGHPELTWSTSALSKNFYNKEIGHSAGDAKMETHVESVTVKQKTGEWLSFYDPCDDATHLKCSVCDAIYMFPGSNVYRPSVCGSCNAIMK
jgi:hypothetical protein